MNETEPSYEPGSIEAAEQKWKRYHDEDPLDSIPRTLLSAADIELYAATVGLIHPFYPTKERLKSASYEVRFGTKFIYWNEQGKKKVKSIAKNDTFTLPANSISYVDLESEFLLPRYIGARFNLRIQHVHRGLLIGTGPLVDPGFRGNLLVPLHNLTSDPYTVRGDEGFIWVEFTKTSYKQSGANNVEEILKKWEERKNNMRPEVYFDNANKNRPIRSSIPVAIAEASKLANDSKIAAEKAERNSKIVLGIGIVAIVGIVISIYSLITTLFLNVHAADGENRTLQRDLDRANMQIESLKSELRAVKDEFQKQPNR